MYELKALIKRNTKMFFKDKGLFFTSLVTPMILLLLYVTFLGKVYRDAFSSVIVGIDIAIPDRVIDACVGGQLMSSLLAVCCITVAFCSNMLMVNDKVNGTVIDLKISPVKTSVIALGYYISTYISTIFVSFSAAVIYLIYLSVVGWYLSVADVLLLLFDVLLLVMFGTALSSIINLYLTSQGQISAVGTIVSSGYGFICGAYMPISQFPETLQKIISFLPGTYGTALLRNHAMRGALREMTDLGIDSKVIESIKFSVDANIDFFGNTVKEPAMYVILGGTVVVLIFIYILLHRFNFNKKRTK